GRAGPRRRGARSSRGGSGGGARRHCPHCVALPIASIATSWNLEPLQLVPTLLAAYAYLRRSRTLARRGQPVPSWRQFLFWLGIALVAAALNSPIADVGEG